VDPVRSGRAERSGGSSSYEPEDTAPDSWEQEDEAAADGRLEAAFTALNVNAKPFVPNVNAAEFVPPAAVGAETLEPAGDTSSSSGGSSGAGSVEVSPSIHPFIQPGSARSKEEAVGVNGDAEMTAEEPWDQKDEEPTQEEPGGGDRGPEEAATPEDTPPEMMMEEEEEVLVPKVPAVQPDAPKKEHINVVFIGHVDAGKSTIGGQIMYLTGMVDKRTLEKYEREAKEKNRETWYLSWALDTNQEERDKGKTVEVGRAYFETDKKHFTILDAPGHKSFVPNMIGGASQADLAVLVISARKGEFETGFEKGGQTREHAMLAKTAGVKHLIVLVNKMDDPTVGWSLERWVHVPRFIFLNSIIRRCEALTGRLGACKRLIQSQLCSEMLICALLQDMGTVVLGKLESGSISKAQQLVMMPNRHVVEVLSLLSDDVETEDAGPGENLKLRLKGIEEEEILPGFILCTSDSLCHSGRTFDAQIVIIEHKSIICPGYNAVLHIHTCIEEVQITALICLVDKKTGDKSKTRPRFVKLCLSAGKTIAIGKVLKLVAERD
uniref:G1 to S phase transition 1, like n=1 Tax=Cyprinodon variegatus TaxID=28743 RepID=A0A3Q2E1Q4_CYPVA